MSDNGFPRGWASTTLSEIRIHLGTSVNPAKTPEQLFELYSVPQHETGEPEIVAGGQVGSSKQTVERGTVLLCKINPRINRVWVVEPRTKNPLIASTEWIPFFYRPEIKPKYLAYFLRQNSVRDFLSSNVSGVGGSLMRVRPAVVDLIEFPLAPRAEQERIVEKIESALSDIDSAVAALERVQANLKRYRASVLKAACEGRLVPTEAELARKERRTYETGEQLLGRILKERRAKWESDQLAKMLAAGKPPKDNAWKNKYKEPAPPDTTNLPELPEGWTWTTLDALLREPLRNGHSAKATNNPDGVRTLTLTAVTLGDFSEGNIKVTSASPENVRDLWLQPGDIFIERANTPELVGTAALFKGAEHFAIFPDLLIRVRLLSSMSGSYVAHWLHSFHARTYFQRAAQGIAGSMPKIDQQAVERLPVPIPPFAEQIRIADEIDRKLSVLDELTTDTKTNVARASRLRQSILKRAFEGKLVPQDPNDEPASVLLDRIRAERTASSTCVPKSNLKRKAHKATAKGASR